MSKFISISILMFIGAIALVGYGFVSEEQRQREAVAAAGVKEIACRGEALPSYGAPAPEGYEECLLEE